ncbi:hypothetical protein COOONC_06132, partial [Cooperia oncophora]
MSATSLAGLILFIRPALMPIRFAVRSLGWTEIAEEDLTAERSSRAVNRAIVDLSTGRNDVMDNVSKWGDVSASFIEYFLHSYTCSLF